MARKNFSDGFFSNLNIFQDYLDRIDSFLSIEKINADSVMEDDEKYFSSQNEQQIDYYYDFNFYYQLFFYSYLISLYYFFEDSIEIYINYERHKQDSSLTLSDIRGRGPKKYRKYLEKVLNIYPNFFPGSGWNEIYIFNSVRNCIVHNNGYLNDKLFASHKNRLEQHITQSDLIKRDESNRLNFSKEYCNNLTGQISNFMESLYRSSGINY